MELPNLLDDLDEIDKLLEIAQSPKKTKKEIDSFILDYITQCNILPGKKKIPTYIIYYHYSQWKKTRLKSRTFFFKNFALKFERTQVQHGAGYLLNPKPFDLTPTGFFKARAFLRKERHEKKKEKSKK